VRSRITPRHQYSLPVMVHIEPLIPNTRACLRSHAHEPLSVKQQGRRSAPSQFEDMSRRVTSPEASRTLLYITKLPPHRWLMHLGSSYPEGNFEGNQLLGSSMSLSPLCLAPTNDLHVSTATSFHRGFPRFHCSKV